MSDQSIERRFTVNREEPILRAELAGAMKPRRESKPEQYGEFGQDYVSVDEATNTMVVADGISSLPDSYRAAELVGSRAKSILMHIPETLTSMAEVKAYIVNELPTLQMVLKAMKGEGATTVLAKRYLSWLDAIAMIDIGDCEAALVVGEQTINLQQGKKTGTSPDNIARNIIQGTNEVRIAMHARRPIEELVSVIDLAEMRRRHPDHPIRAVVSSDGIQNNTGAPLARFAADIAKHGATPFVARINKGRDDIGIGSMQMGA